MLMIDNSAYNYWIKLDRLITPLISDCAYRAGRSEESRLEWLVQVKYVLLILACVCQARVCMYRLRGAASRLIPRAGGTCGALIIKADTGAQMLLAAPMWLSVARSAHQIFRDYKLAAIVDAANSRARIRLPTATAEPANRVSSRSPDRR